MAKCKQCREKTERPNYNNTGMCRDCWVAEQEEQDRQYARQARENLVGSVSDRDFQFMLDQGHI